MGNISKLSNFKKVLENGLRYVKISSFKEETE